MYTADNMQYSSSNFFVVIQYDQIIPDSKDNQNAIVTVQYDYLKSQIKSVKQRDVQVYHALYKGVFYREV